ncbi:MAG: hypothetical protein ACRC1K_19965 [Planctomycetia bacterium]
MGHPLEPSKELRLLLAFFGESTPPQCRETLAAAVPEPYRRLLVHQNHMTVTLEQYIGAKVRVRPYQVHQQGDLYGRKLDLFSEANGQLVMTGLMLFNFSFSTPVVREQIVSQAAPIGRILIENDILREITAESFLQIDADDPLVKRFELSTPRPAFGRLATIFCDKKPAVDLLEIVNPEITAG